jgi:hypothetical protein
VPQGSYKNVYDITYHSRDSRRQVLRERIDTIDATKDGLPPTPGNPISVTFCGLAGDWDVAK